MSILEKKILYQPYLNPVKFVKETPTVVAQYHTKHMDDWRFGATIQPWQQATCFAHGWQTNDTIKLQLQSNYGPISLQLIRISDGAVMHTVSFAQLQQNIDFPGMYIHETDLELSPFAAGSYYLKIIAGSPVLLTLISELIVISENIENSVLLEYNHDHFYGDVIFETGFSPSMRVPANIKYKQSTSKDTTYEDQSLNMTMIKSVPYRLWDFILGPVYGVPPWMVDKVNVILGCSNVRGDGRYYTKSDGAKLEESTEDNYPMSAWRIELREKLKRDSVIYEDEGEVDGAFNVIIAADSKGFGAQASGSNYFIEDII